MSRIVGLRRSSPKHLGLHLEALELTSSGPFMVRILLIHDTPPSDGDDDDDSSERHGHRSQIEERRIRDDAALEEAKRCQDEKHRQEKIKVTAEVQAKLEAEKKRKEEALESQRAAKEAAEKLVTENSKKAAALAISLEATAQTVRTRVDGAEKATSSGNPL
ncbi:hypothetical protein AgCh_032723 [Apium graveolens]